MVFFCCLLCHDFEYISWFLHPTCQTFYAAWNNFVTSRLLVTSDCDLFHMSTDFALSNSWFLARLGWLSFCAVSCRMILEKILDERWILLRSQRHCSSNHTRHRSHMEDNGASLVWSFYVFCLFALFFVFIIRVYILLFHFHIEDGQDRRIWSD